MEGLLFVINFTIRSGFRVAGIWFLVSGFYFLVSGFWFLVSGCGLVCPPISDLRSLVSPFWPGTLVGALFFLATGATL